MGKFQGYEDVADIILKAAEIVHHKEGKQPTVSEMYQQRRKSSMSPETLQKYHQ